MKLFSFPAAALEKAIHKRILNLPIHHRDWFNDRWKQKPYKKAFIENKAMPLVTLVAKGKTWDDDTFNEVMSEWDVRFYDAEIEVLRPLIQSDGLLQLMQKNLPPERVQALLDKLEAQRIRNTDAPLAPPAEPSTD